MVFLFGYDVIPWKEREWASYPCLAKPWLSHQTKENAAECLLARNAKARLDRVILFVVLHADKNNNAMQCRCSTTREGASDALMWSRCDYIFVVVVVVVVTMVINYSNCQGLGLRMLTWRCYWPRGCCGCRVEILFFYGWTVPGWLLCLFFFLVIRR